MLRVSAEAAAQALAGIGLDPGVDLEALWWAADLVDEHIGDAPVAPLRPRLAVRSAQRKIPVGLIAALDDQLRASGAADRLDEILEEIARVRVEAGSAPLAAPIGQIVASQAIVNVLGANRYGTLVDEFRNLVSGRFGHTPGPIDPALARAVERLGGGADEAPLDMEALRESAKGLASSEEELLLLALFPGEAEGLLRAIRQRATGDETAAAQGVDRTREQQIRDVVRIVQETGVREIHVGNAEPVEYGQLLFELEPLNGRPVGL